MTQEEEDNWVPPKSYVEEQLDFSRQLALEETQRWIEAILREKLVYEHDFRRSLASGVVLCNLLNVIKPGSISKINKKLGEISGIDNLTAFLYQCENVFGIPKTKLFQLTDLEDLHKRALPEKDIEEETERRMLRVAVTIFWLAKATELVPFADQLSHKAYNGVAGDLVDASYPEVDGDKDHHLSEIAYATPVQTRTALLSRPPTLDYSAFAVVVPDWRNSFTPTPNSWLANNKKATSLFELETQKSRHSNRQISLVDNFSSSVPEKQADLSTKVNRAVAVDSVRNFGTDVNGRQDSLFVRPDVYLTNESVASPVSLRASASPITGTPLRDCTITNISTVSHLPGGGGGGGGSGAVAVNGVHTGRQPHSFVIGHNLPQHQQQPQQNNSSMDGEEWQTICGCFKFKKKR